MSDFIEAGTDGPMVMLLHSSVSGAKMWRRLMDALKDRYRVRAVNLIGYGRTPPWASEASQSLDDQARVVEAALPDEAEPIYLVGHSFGGSVAMKTAARLGERVAKLALLEANPCYLLRQAGRHEAYARATAMRDCVKAAGATGDWDSAAATFADHWGGAGAWDAMPADRRATFVAALRPNFFEWDAVIDEETPLERWGELLPRATMYLHDPGTTLPIRETVELLRGAHPHWTFHEIAGGGHMAPLTRPDLVNPIIAEFLDG
jgi:pimeloyl-ACP methyl ester carboxylesterase